MGLLFLLLSLAHGETKCYSELDLLHARCDVACQREGYKTGSFVNKKCACTDHYDYERITGKKLYMPKRPAPKSTSSASYYTPPTQTFIFQQPSSSE